MKFKTDNEKFLFIFSDWRRAGAIVLPLLLLPIIVGVLFMTLTLTSTTYAAPTAPTNVIMVDTAVDDLTDNNNCTLREAIEAANTNTAVDNCSAGSVGEDTIILSNQVYTLSIGGIGEDSNQTGDFDILESLVISGSGATVDGDRIDRIFHVDPALSGVNLTLDHLTVSHGEVESAGGGGIRVEQGRVALLNSHLISNTAVNNAGGGVYINTGYIYLLNSSIISNTADNNGGGIYINAGVIDIVDSQLEHNEANSNGGAIYTRGGNVHLDNSEIYSNTASAEGGGIYNFYGTIRLLNKARVKANIANYGGGIFSHGGGTFIDDSSITENNANSYGGGIVSNNGNYGGIIIENSTLSHNNALGTQGGGLYVGSDGGAVISNTIVSHNTATTAGGGIYHDSYGTLYLDSSSVLSNTSDTDGGGIYARALATVVLIDTTMEYNGAQQNGGAVYMDFDAALTIQDSALSYNTAITTGGAIYLNDRIPTRIQSSSLIGNEAYDGGAIGTGTSAGAIAIENSTLSQNNASNTGGAIFAQGTNLQISLNHATVISNAATSSGGAFYLAGSTGVVVQNSVLAGNSDDQCTEADDHIISAGHNILDGNCPLQEPSDQMIASGTLFTTVLNPLADNGGFAETHALQANSPAIDAAGDDTCLPTDQTGTARPQGNACDIGAVESNFSATPPTIPTNTINVTTFLDDMVANGNCTLREAVEAANKNIAIDNCAAGKPFTTTVDIISLPAGTYVLSVTGTLEDMNLTGDLDIAESVHIQGAGRDTTTIDANHIDRIFHLNPIISNWLGVDFTLTDVTLMNGQANNGGAIYVPYGAATLQNSAMISNVSTLNGGAIGMEMGALWAKNINLTNNDAQDGGGIYHQHVTVNWWDSTWSDNNATENGGGAADTASVVQIDNTTIVSNTSTGAYGGGIYSNIGNFHISNSRINWNDTIGDGGGINIYSGWLTLRESEVNDNVADDNGGGGIYRHNGGESIFNSQINGNTAQDGHGGGLYSYHGVHLVQNSELKNNTSNNNGGGLFMEYGFLLMLNTVVEGNVAESDGGGLYNYETASDIRNSIFRDNRANGVGGGINFYFYASHLIRDSVIENNTAIGNGGGIFKDDEPSVYIENTTISGNKARNGGGIYSSDYSTALFELLNSTISNNEAAEVGGGIHSGDPFYFNYVTIVSNTAVITAGGIYLHDENAVIQNSIVAGNFEAGSDTSTTANCDDSNANKIATNGHNVFVANTGCNPDPRDILISAPAVFANLIEPLADNNGRMLPDGSVVQTRNLQYGSQAIDGGESLLCPIEDQRGYGRPVATHCDIGAVELQPVTLFLPVIFK